MHNLDLVVVQITKLLSATKVSLRQKKSQDILSLSCVLFLQNHLFLLFTKKNKVLHSALFKSLVLCFPPVYLQCFVAGQPWSASYISSSTRVRLPCKPASESSSERNLLMVELWELVF